MAETPLVFHACPPAGHWLNDPNGLIYAEGAYRLFAQHRADAPEFRETGWARFSSPDLLDWTFDGSVIPEQQAWAYSGCVIALGDGLEAVHTSHEAGLERQVRRTSGDAGLTWSDPAALPALGAAARNRRDPFVFRDRHGWALLLAEPCDWFEWRDAPQSQLRIYRSPDRITWTEVGVIGPWRAVGIMWEVPVLARIDGHDVLFVSEVDRREGGAACSVRAWIGQIDMVDFTLAPGVPEDGQLIDYGPDFYALMTSSGSGWPLDRPAFVAWLSNWQDARKIAWPGFHGGPISFPRTLSIEGRRGELRVCNRPMPQLLERFTRRISQTPASGLGRLNTNAERLTIVMAAGGSSLVADIDWSEGSLGLKRSGACPWRKVHRFVADSSESREVLILRDGPTIELFLTTEGLSASFVIADGDKMQISATHDFGPLQFDWFELQAV